VVLLGCAAVSLAAETPIPPPPARFVTDTVGLLSPQARATLDAQLEAYARSSGNQVVVWIGQTTGDTPTEDWTVRTFERWKVGQKGLDNGLVVFIFSADRKVRVEVGYGLEDRVPDVVAVRVIREVMAPRMQAGDADGAVAAGLNALVAAISGQPDGLGGAGQAPGRSAPAKQLSTGQIILFALLAIGFVILLITNPSLALYLLFTVLSGGRGGGYSGGGGGFSGGGGRSGGGGATGSW